MIPKIIFHRSKIYDRQLKRTSEFELPPAESVFRSRIKEYREAWDKEGHKILEELESVTKLKWHENEIICYVTWGIYPYSDPLTINVSRYPKSVKDGPEITMDILTHELIHRMLSHPLRFPKIKENWEKLMKKYPECSRVTKAHIAVHAVHEHVLRKFYGKERLLREMQDVKDPNYVLSWEIVKRDGYQNIIRELTAGL